LPPPRLGGIAGARRSAGAREKVRPSFYGGSGRGLPGVIGKPFTAASNHGREGLRARFSGLLPGQPTGLRAAAAQAPARPGWLAAPGRAGWARTGRGGYPGIQPGLPLRAAPPTASALATAMLGTYLLDHVQQHRLGRFFGRPGYLPIGNLLGWMRVCVLEESLAAPLACPGQLLPNCCPIVN
jgi:hypothetical protein